MRAGMVPVRCGLGPLHLAFRVRGGGFRAVCARTLGADSATVCHRRAWTRGLWRACERCETRSAAAVSEADLRRLAGLKK